MFWLFHHMSAGACRLSNVNKMSFSKMLADDSFDLLMSQTDINDISYAEELDLPNFSLGLDEKSFDVNEFNQENKQSVSNNDNGNKRFITLPETDLDDIARANSERATVYQTRWALKLFRGTISLLFYTLP